MTTFRNLVGSVALSFFVTTIVAPTVTPPEQDGTPETVVIDANAPGRPLHHFWEHIFGSGRAVLSLREGYRQDLRAVRRDAGLRYVRFHAIFHDEIGLYSEDKQGEPVYNFSYIDEIYDGLLENSVRPFVEISFMPAQLSAEPPIRQNFWYKPIVSPPKDWSRWDALITAFAHHLVARYGVAEVSQWYFEVWNEPNLDFWAGDPKFDTYLQLYDHTVRALKNVNAALRVGGPSTAQAAWVDQFIAHAASASVPLDFVSTHVYGTDKPEKVLGTSEAIGREHMVCRAVRKVHDQIAASAMPKLPLIFSEYNASARNEPAVTDTPYMGPWLANTVRECDELADEMAFWTFSDTFEEQGVVKRPFYGGFGLLAAGHIPKPSYNAFWMLHRLGEQRIASDSDSMLITRRENHTVAVLAWNLVPANVEGSAKSMRLVFRNTKGSRARLWRLDDHHGDVGKAYRAMGAPASPTQSQLEQLQRAAQIPNSEQVPLHHGELSLQVPAHGLVLIELQ